MAYPMIPGRKTCRRPAKKCTTPERRFQAGAVRKCHRECTVPRGCGDMLGSGHRDGAVVDKSWQIEGMMRILMVIVSLVNFYSIAGTTLVGRVYTVYR